LVSFKWRGAQSLDIYNDGQKKQDVKDYTQYYCIDMLDILQQSITYAGPNTQDQARRHLLEVDAWIATTGRNYANLDIYDNSSGHNCMAIDALNSEKLNIGVGGKNQVIYTWIFR
jgi:hypothetical protein